MKNIPLIIFTIILTSISAFGSTFYLTDYGAIANDSRDDAPAFQAAFDVMAEQGCGVLVLPDGHIDVKTPVSKIFNHCGSLTIQGSGGSSRMNISVGQTNTAFTLASISLARLDNLTVFGVGDHTIIDAKNVFYFTSVTEAIIENSEFVNLRVGTDFSIDAIIKTHWTSLTMRNCLVGGFGGTNAIRFTDGGALKVSKNQFIDYQWHTGVYYSKNAPHITNWIYATHGVVGEGTTPQVSLIEDNFFDEGAHTAARVEDAKTFIFARNTINLYSYVWGAGIRAKKVENVFSNNNIYKYAYYEQKAIEVQDVELLKSEYDTFLKQVTNIQTLGKPGIVVIRRLKRENIGSFPNVVDNLANSTIHTFDF